MEAGPSTAPPPRPSSPARLEVAYQRLLAMKQRLPDLPAPAVYPAGVREGVCLYIVTICEAFSLLDAAVLALTYFDRYVSASVREGRRLDGSEIRLVSNVCIQLASSFYSKATVAWDEFCCHGNVYTKEQHKAKQIDVLQKLSWSLHTVTAGGVLEQLGEAFLLGDPQRAVYMEHAESLISLSLTETGSLAFSPLVIASAALQVGLWFGCLFECEQRQQRLCEICAERPQVLHRCSEFLLNLMAKAQPIAYACLTQRAASAMPRPTTPALQAVCGSSSSPVVFGREWYDSGRAAGGKRSGTPTHAVPRDAASPAKRPRREGSCSATPTTASASRGTPTTASASPAPAVVRSTTPLAAQRAASRAEVGVRCESRLSHRGTAATPRSDSSLATSELWAWESLSLGNAAADSMAARRFLPVSRSTSRATCDGRTTASTEFLESTVLRDLEDVFDDDAEVSRASLEL